MLPNPDDVHQVTALVLETTIGDAPASRGPTVPPPGSVRSVVEISGAWIGTVSVAFAPSLAKLVASAMFGDDEPSTSDIEDAIREIANMVGGNVKALVPGPSALSLPRIERLDDADEGARRCTLYFEVQGETMEVTITKRTGQGTAT